MPFLVDEELCRRVLASAKGASAAQAGLAAADLAEEIFGREDRFVTRLDDSPVPFAIERRQAGARNFVVRSGLIYIHVGSRPNVAVIAPPHFVTDHASVPALLRGIFPPSGAHSAAAVLHDWLYAVAEPPKNQTRFRKERFRADRIFLDAMKTSGVGATRRSLLYRGVRLFGTNGFGAA